MLQAVPEWLPSVRHSAEAGSTDNDITVRFEAQGSMDGGQVRLDLPDGLGHAARDKLVRRKLC